MKLLKILLLLVLLLSLIGCTQEVSKENKIINDLEEELNASSVTLLEKQNKINK